MNTKQVFTSAQDLVWCAGTLIPRTATSASGAVVRVSVIAGAGPWSKVWIGSI
jgi:hypothetical protein